MRRVGLYAVIAAVLITITALLMTMMFDSALDRRSIMISAVLAFVVQLAAFAAVALASSTNIMAGWGIGVLVRLLVLVAYALLVIQAIGLAPVAALISLAAFFFLCTLVEPLVLRT